MAKLAPHPELSEYYPSATQRQIEVNALFNDSASYYDRVTQWMSFGSGSWYRRDALRRHGVKEGVHLLDTGAGTGAVTLPAQELVGETGRVVALDPSQNMLATGVERGIKNPVQGIAEDLPFDDNSFDFVTMGYALRHVSDLNKAFSEYRRVLKPGGKVLILEITKPKNKIGLISMKVYMRYLIPMVSGLLSGKGRVRRLMEYYWDTIEACVPPQTVLDALNEANFATPKRNRVLGIFSEYSGGQAELSALLTSR